MTEKKKGVDLAQEKFVTPAAAWWICTQQKVVKVSRTTGTKYAQYWKPSWHAFYPVLFHQFSCNACPIKGNKVN